MKKQHMGAIIRIIRRVANPAAAASAASSASLSNPPKFMEPELLEHTGAFFSWQTLLLDDTKENSPVDSSLVI